MTTVYFPAIVEGEKKDGYSVFFPDLPGLASAGDTLQDAAINAADALRGHLALMIRDGDEIPKASVFDDLPADPQVQEAARILVRAELPGKAVRLNISLEEGLVNAIDAAASARGLTRSGFIADVARKTLNLQ
jgi:predicted RNase H-like HicB family nuclease